MPLNDDTSSVFHMRIVRKRTNNKRHKLQWGLAVVRDIYTNDNDLYLFTREGRIKNAVTILAFVLRLFSWRAFFCSFTSHLHRAAFNTHSSLFPPKKRAHDEKSIQKYCDVVRRRLFFGLSRLIFFGFSCRPSWSSHKTIPTVHHPSDSSRKSGTRTSMR